MKPTRNLLVPLAVLILAVLPACQRKTGEVGQKAGSPAPQAARPADLTIPAISTPAPPILERAADTLKPGEFLWRPEASPEGPLLIVVSIPDQRAHVYRNGIAIGISTVSTGRRGHATPTGVFTILEKDEKHFSKTYNNAPMPFMERLTWDGIALHAGNLPGYPASHGCVRLPKQFAKHLFGVTQKGFTVVIADDEHFAQNIAHPGLLAPLGPKAVQPQDLEAPGAGQFVWEPAKAQAGPIAILLSSADRAIYAYRAGVEIGRARVDIQEPARPLGRSVYHMIEGFADQPSPILPGRPAHRWTRVHFPKEGPGAATSTIASRVRLPRAFAESLYAALAPGATLHTTDLPISGAARTPPGFVVLSEHGSDSGG